MPLFFGFDLFLEARKEILGKNFHLLFGRFEAKIKRLLLKLSDLQAETLYQVQGFYFQDILWCKMKNVSMPSCWNKQLTKKDSFQEKWPVDQRLRDYLLNCSVEMKLLFVAKIWVSIFFYIGKLEIHKIFLQKNKHKILQKLVLNLVPHMYFLSP